LPIATTDPGRHDTWRVGDVGGQIDHPAGMDHPNDHIADVLGQAGEIRFGTDRRERAPVDLSALADIVTHR
jgi:hypothetical protein